jgi:hypothetical protein
VDKIQHLSRQPQDLRELQISECTDSTANTEDTG